MVAKPVSAVCGVTVLAVRCGCGQILEPDPRLPSPVVQCFGCSAIWQITLTRLQSSTRTVDPVYVPRGTIDAGHRLMESLLAAKHGGTEDE